jgi:hypothetical protein
MIIVPGGGDIYMPPVSKKEGVSKVRHTLFLFFCLLLSAPFLLKKDIQCVIVHSYGYFSSYFCYVFFPLSSNE